MNATNYYVSTSRVVLQGDPEAAQTWQDLCRTLPILRNSLSCTVCESLLVEPYTPEDTDCEHHVCKGCKGGNKVMKPACSWCKDYSKYFENVQLRILIQNYKKLCGLIKITRLWNIIEKQGDQGKDIMDIVTESEGIKIRRNILKTSVSDYVGTKIKMEKVEVNDQMANVIEPPDEITSSPVSKLSIYRNNPDIKQLDNIKVKLLEELTHLSPGVSPPHSTASSLSSTNNIQKRKIKETFILNPFKGKSDLQGPFKKLDAPPKVQETSLLRKYSLDAYSEKKILFKEEKCSEIEQPQAKVLRLSVDNYAISQSDLDEEVDYTKNDSVLTEPESMDDSIFSKTVEPLSGASEPNKPPGNPKTKAKKSGCRCGNATLCPGKLTCCGQRCPCYVDSMPCIDCKCKGCRNPHMPGGGKMRPALPMLQNAKMKVFYPGTSQEHTVYTTSTTISNPLIYQPGASDNNKIIYPVRTFPSRIKKDSEPGGRGKSSKMVGDTISIKDLDLSKLPMISLNSVSTGNLSTFTVPVSSISTTKPVTRVVVRSSSLQK